MVRHINVFMYDELIPVIKPLARTNLVRFMLRQGKLTPEMLDGEGLLTDDEPFLADWAAHEGVWFHGDGRVYLEDFVTDE